ncbi:hypothetical protein HK102_011219 [Quaeritorhiza haematococci]|nr:hypothetical protein HK102_011219 [Quaeritorhiza haematococci]
MIFETLGTPLTLISKQLEREREKEEDQFPLNQSHTLSENENQIKNLYRVEKRIVMLLNVASRAMELLAEETDIDGAKDEFERQFTAYMELLNEIQSSLRKIFRQLAGSGVLSAATGSSIPYYANVQGVEKDFELTAQGVSLVSKFLRSSISNIDQADLHLDVKD